MEVSRQRLAWAVAVAVAALFALTAPPAPAADGAARSTSADAPGAVSDGYWTPERMRAAENLDLPEPALPATGTNPLSASLAAAAGPRLDVPPTAAAASAPAERRFSSGPVANPAGRSVRMHGRVFFTLPGGGDAACSGTAVRSNRASLVLTAGHCVHGGGHTGDWFKHWVFVPGYAQGNAPFGMWRASRLYAMPIWVEFGDQTGDIGMARMKRNESGRLQRVVGARGISFGRQAKQRYTAYGYPANPADGFDGQTERFCGSKFRKRDPASRRGIGPETISIRCDMTQGASGGGWIARKGYATSVTSYGYPDLNDVIFGPYFGSLARGLYEATQTRCGNRVATIVGTNGPDRIRGTKHRDVVSAGAGADTVKGLGKRDLVCGGPGADRLLGQEAGDTLFGQSGDDFLNGGRGKRNRCYGGGGKNRGKHCQVERGIP